MRALRGVPGSGCCSKSSRQDLKGHAGSLPQLPCNIECVLLQLLRQLLLM
jgi:hypothetical protein